jgi:hypothetical protein
MKLEDPCRGPQFVQHSEVNLCVLPDRQTAAAVRRCSTWRQVPAEVLPLKRSAKTRADQAKQLEKLKAIFGDMPADKITAQHCYRYLDGRAKHPVAARHEISLLGHVFAKVIRWGAATVNPVRTLERTPKGGRTKAGHSARRPSLT